MQSSQHALLLAWRRLKKTKRARSQRETHTTNLSVWNCWRAPPPARRIGRLRVWNSLPPHPNKSGHRGYAAATVTSQEAAAGWQRRCQTLDLERRDQVTSRLFVGFVFFFFGLCLSLSPGTAVTSLSKVKSSSSVGGWCCRGQFDTAAVSCSSNKIHTWIRPAGHETTKMRWRERRREKGGGFLDDTKTAKHREERKRNLCRHQTPGGHSPCRPRCWSSVPAISSAGWRAAHPGTPA